MTTSHERGTSASGRIMPVDEVSICAVGDIMAGDSSICVGWGMASRWPGERFGDAIFAARRDLLAADITIGNLESPLTVTGRGRTRWARDQMRALPGVAMQLREAGFSVLNVANNHAVQHGVDGFTDTVTHLRNAGIAVVGLRGNEGWHCAPVIIPVRTVRVGILGYSWRPMQYGDSLPPYADANIDGVVADVSRLRGQCDVVIVSLHWGDEFVEQPSASDVQNAERIIEAGASLIVGHHPHVLRPVVEHRGALVAFSLGNFASDMLWLEDTRTGAMLRAQFGPNGCSAVSVQRVYSDSEYRVELVHGGTPELVRAGLDAQHYMTQVQRGLARQRRHAYRYAVRNILQPPLPVLLELVSRTVLNKIFGLWR